MSKFARLLKEVKEKEEASGERPRGKSRREDYVAMKVYISKELHRRLKLKAVEEEKELSELVEEAEEVTGVTSSSPCREGNRLSGNEVAREDTL